MTVAAISLPQSMAYALISGGSIVLALLGRRLVRRYRLPPLDMFLVLLLVTIPAYLLGWSQKAAGGKTAVSLIQMRSASSGSSSCCASLRARR